MELPLTSPSCDPVFIYGLHFPQRVATGCPGRPLQGFAVVFKVHTSPTYKHPQAIEEMQSDSPLWWHRLELYLQRIKCLDDRSAKRHKYKSKTIAHGAQVFIRWTRDADGGRYGGEQCTVVSVTSLRPSVSKRAPALRETDGTYVTSAGVR